VQTVGMIRDDGSVDLGDLSRTWEARWPQCRPLGYELRGMRDRWVRFHSLSGSKRYAESDDEYEVVLGRNHSVLSDLGDRYQEEGEHILVVTYSWSSSPEPEPQGAADLAKSQHWMSLQVDSDEEDNWTHLSVSASAWRNQELDPLLRRVADDEERALIMPIDLRWLFAPYDGGMDVIVATTAGRDELRSAHAGWLSALPSGL
jgi:hypothetical protein